MGILGIYIGKTFEETKARPLYVIKDTVNLEMATNCTSREVDTTDRDAHYRQY
jgi:hypothetical protein